MQIVIASGKGGTGKTTTAVNLALTLQNVLPVTLLDCDVEEPNVHLFLRPEFATKTKVFSTVPVVNTAKCDSCGECSSFCAFNAIAVIKAHPIVFPELCHGCGGCSLVCPQGAITEKPRQIGRVEHGTSESILVSHGYLQIGSPLAPDVVEAVREGSSNRRTNEVVIIDAPPGTSCAVVAAAQGADYCLLVTEPTPLGLNDLQLAVGLARKLGLPHGVIVNRAGVGDRQVYEYCYRENIPILMEIPFNPKYAACYARGGRLVEEFPTLRTQFQNLWKQIQREVAEHTHCRERDTLKGASKT